MSDKRRTIGAAGGAVGLGGAAAFLSACCVAPWAVSLLGAAGAVTMARLSFLQPYLLAGAVLLLSLAFWAAYRPLPVCADGAGAQPDRTALRWIAWTAAAMVAVLALVACLPSLGLA